MDRPCWEYGYTDPAASTFGKPSADVVRLADTLPAGATVLDVGCGDGRNALFLASRGLNVAAFDVSEAGVEKLRRAAGTLPVRAWVDDAATYAFDGAFDAVICHGVLHLLARTVQPRVIEGIRRCTRPGGVSVIAVFTGRVPAPPDLAPFFLGLFEEGELATLFADWHIESAEAYVFEDEHPGGFRHTHAVEKVTARKPRR